MLGTLIIALVLILGVITVRAMREERAAIAVTSAPNPLAVEKRVGLRVVFAAVLFAGSLLVLAFATDGVGTGKNAIPTWLTVLLTPPTFVATVVGIYGSPFVIAFGLAAGITGQIPRSVLVRILAGYSILFASVSMSFITNLWYSSAAFAFDDWAQSIVLLVAIQATFVYLFLSSRSGSALAAA